jgi:hypothetical protein
MTPQEKAKELIDKFYDIEYADFYQNNEHSMNWSEIQQCALITVDELQKFELRIAEQIEFLTKKANGEFKLENLYWESVKEEIKKL